MCIAVGVGECCTALHCTSLTCWPEGRKIGARLEMKLESEVETVMKQKNFNI